MTTPKLPVLVTGGAGYIGSHAVLALLDAGWPVTVIDNLSTGFRWAVPEDATFVEGDIGDPALVGQVIVDHGIKAIMHFAGSILVGESVEKPLDYYENNTVKSRTLIETVVKTGVPHFIFSSTAAVYGIPETVPITEATRLQPINPYGWSKMMTERMLADAARVNDFNYGALRYFNVAGADPQGRSGQSSKVGTHIIKVAAETVVGKRDYVGIYGTDYDTPDGTGVRDYIHVSDLAAAHVAALEKLIEAPEENLVLNCGYGRGFSVLEVLDAMDRVTGNPIERRIEGRRAGDPDTLVADNAKILTSLNWRPQRDRLEDIVADALSWEWALRKRQAA